MTLPLVACQAVGPVVAKQDGFRRHETGENARLWMLVGGWRPLPPPHEESTYSEVEQSIYLPPCPRSLRCHLRPRPQAHLSAGLMTFQILFAVLGSSTPVSSLLGLGKDALGESRCPRVAVEIGAWQPSLGAVPRSKPCETQKTTLSNAVFPSPDVTSACPRGSSPGRQANS